MSEFYESTIMDTLNKARGTKMPQRMRRKDARPTELIEAASSVFGEKGYAATRLEDVARRAGVSKATVYVYFENKESLFRAVARGAMASRAAEIRLEAAVFDESLALALENLITRFLEVNDKDNIVHLVRMVISEAHNFPDVAGIWNEEVVQPIMNRIAELISRAQSRGEAVSGDPNLIAFSVMGPLQMALLHRSTFTVNAGKGLMMDALAKQHLKILINGLLPR